MKTSLSIIFLAFLTSIGHSQVCSVGDLSPSSGSNSGGGVDVYQSFFAGCDGQISSIEVNISSATFSTFDLVVYQGGPTNQGSFSDCSHMPTTELYRQTFTPVIGSHEYIFTSTGPNVSMGQVYSFAIDFPSGGLIGFPLNTNDVGGLNYGGIDQTGACICFCLFSSQDFAFNVQINERPQNIPTMSQWGVFILFLLMVTFGTLGIRHKMLYKRA